MAWCKVELEAGQMATDRCLAPDEPAWAFGSSAHPHLHLRCRFPGPEALVTNSYAREANMSDAHRKECRRLGNRSGKINGYQQDQPSRDTRLTSDDGWHKHR